MPTTPPAQQEQDAVQHVQQDLVQLPAPSIPGTKSSTTSTDSGKPGQPQLNWSYFKPEFSGKPEDGEAHLLRTNDWMETHNLLEVTKVQRFCLTVTGEARLIIKTYSNRLDRVTRTNQTTVFEIW